jgi:hypothetical protein
LARTNRPGCYFAKKKRKIFLYLGHIIGLYGGGCLRGAPSLFVHRKVEHARVWHRIHAFAAQRRFLRFSPIKNHLIYLKNRFYKNCIQWLKINVLARQYLVAELEERCRKQLMARMEPPQAMTVLDFTLGTGEELEQRALELCARFTSEVLESEAFLAATWKALQMMFQMKFISDSVSEVDLFRAVYF